MAALLDGPPLWGSSYPEELRGEQLIPYFWGYRHDGVRLEALDEVLEAVDGPGPKTEIDLFLRGSGILIAVEAKHTSSFGRCSRYASGRCPEVHLPLDGDEACRYWEPGPSHFSDLLAFGSRPDPESLDVPCNIHYQLARTLLIGQTLARQLGLAFGLWVIVAQTGWRGLEKTWLAFTECVRDDRQWRMMRVVSWEQIRKLPV